MTLENRKKYWADAMTNALDFMKNAKQVPVVESGEPLVDLATCEKNGASWDVNASALGELGVALLRERLVLSFINAARDLNELGLEPVVHYAYRSPEMQKFLLRSDRVLDQVIDRVLWEFGPLAATPELAYDRLIVLCANSFANGTHLAGTAVDITIRRLDGSGDLDVGGEYLEISELTPMDSPFISSAAREGRELVTKLMLQSGFYAYPYEFWHYSKDDVYGVLLEQTAPPVPYGPVDVNLSSGAVYSMQDSVGDIVSRNEFLPILSDRLSLATKAVSDE